MSDEIEQALEADPRYQALSGPDRVLARKQVYEAMGQQPPSYISKPGTRELDEEGPVHKYVRPVLEGAGMAAGAVTGSGLGPIGTAGGGALGYAGGDALASLAERVAGERPPMSSLAQAGRETVDALKQGGLTEMGSRLFSKVGGAVADKVMAPFRGQYEGANQTLDEVAKSKGITLDPHEVLQNRPLALGHKVLENVPFTSGMIQRNELKKLDALTKEWQRTRDSVGAPDRERLGEIGNRIQTEIERHINKIGVRQDELRDKMRDELLQSVGSPVTYRELGETTQKALKEKHQALKTVEDAAWNYAREAVPETSRVINKNLAQEAALIGKEYENIPSFLDEPLVKQLKDVSASGNKKYDAMLATIPEGLPPQIRKKLVDDIEKTEKPGWSVDSLLKLRSELNSAMAAHHSGIQRGDVKAGGLDAYGRVYTRLIKAVDRDIQEFSDAAGTDISNRFKLARAASGERMSLFDPKSNPWVVKAIEGEASTLDRTLIKPGNAAGYTALKESVGKTAAKPVKQSFTNRLLGVGGKEEGGLASLRSTLDRYGKQTLAEVYSPTEIKNLYELADKSNWMKKSPIGNPFFRELVKTAPSQVAPTILEHPDLTAKIMRTFPHMKQPLRQSFVDGIHPNEKTPFPTKMIETLNAYPPNVQRQLFTPAELKDFHQLAKVIERTKGTVKLAENPSGTAQNLVTFSTAGMVLKHPIKAIPHILGTGAIAKLYLSPTGRQYLLQGLVTPSNGEGASLLAMRIAGIAGMQPGNMPHSEPNERYLSGSQPRQ